MKGKIFLFFVTICISSYIFSYKIFITPSHELFYFIKEKTHLSKNIKIVVDKWNSENFSLLKYLKGIEVKIIKKNDGNMHLKMLINEKGVLLGSYNLTYRAREKNDEYIIFLFNDKIKMNYISLFNKICRVYSLKSQ